MKPSATYDIWMNDLDGSVVANVDLWRAEASHSNNSMERHIAAWWQQRHGVSHNGMETAATSWSIEQQLGGGNTVDHGEMYMNHGYGSGRGFLQAANTSAY